MLILALSISITLYKTLFEKQNAKQYVFVFFKLILYSVIKIKLNNYF